MSILADHPRLFAIVLLLILVLAVELGFRLAAVTAAGNDEVRREQITASRDALGVLLSLLLGFTLAMALPRYDLRRQLVLDEANAIGTVALRAEILPEPYRASVRGLLLEYARARLEFSRAGNSSEQWREPVETAKRLQNRLWAEAAHAAQLAPTPITGLFLGSLNDMIDLGEKRTAALENRIPLSIWLMLATIALLTCLMFGYATRRRFWLVWVITPLMIAVVLGLIADLDSARSGFIRTDLRSLERVERDLAVSPQEGK